MVVLETLTRYLTAVAMRAERIKKNERGETNMIAVALLILLAVILFLVLKAGASSFLNNILDRLNGTLG